MICKNCGAESAENALFCNKCGSALKDEPINLDLTAISAPAAKRVPRTIKVTSAKAEPKQEEPKTAEQPQPEPAPEQTEPEMIDEQPVQAEEIAAESPAEQAPGKAESSEEEKLLDKQYRPMRKRDWLPVIILTCIPVVNLIMLIIWSASKKINKSKKSYAQMQLILLIIFTVLLAIIFFVGVTLFGVDYFTQMIS